MTAAAEAATFVPDGDPCPKHGEPSRLLQGAAGLFSQCAKCRDAFLDWHYRQHADIHVQPANSKISNIADSATSDLRPVTMPAWRARQIANAKPAPAPPQLGLSL